MKLKNKRVLFFSRANDIYSHKLGIFLKKKFRFVKIALCENSKDKIKFNNFEKSKIDYIFSFRFLFKIPKEIIDRASICINFHPGPPEFRGIGCVNFALFNEVKKYGVTAHVMSNKIDNGKILDVIRFKINKNHSVQSLLEKSYKLQLTQAKKIITQVYKNENFFFNYQNTKFTWSKKITTRNDLNKLYKISTNVNKVNLKKIIRSTYTFSYRPYIVFKGENFFYEKK